MKSASISWRFFDVHMRMNDRARHPLFICRFVQNMPDTISETRL